MTEYEWRIVFANRLRDMLEKKQMTQKELSKKSGVSLPYLNTCLILDKTPSVAMILKICNALGCTMDKLVV